MKNDRRWDLSSYSLLAEPTGCGRTCVVGSLTPGSGTAREQRPYELIRQPGPIVDRTFEIEFLDAGVEAFAFTFG